MVVGAIGHTAGVEGSTPKKDNKNNEVSVKKVAMLASAAISILATMWIGGKETRATGIAAALCCMGFAYMISKVYHVVPQYLRTAYVKQGSPATIEVALRVYTFHQLYKGFGLDNAISLLGLDQMQKKFKEEISDPKTTLAHLVIRYPNLEQLFEKKIVPQELYDLMCQFIEKGQEAGNAPLDTTIERVESFGLFYVYTWKPSNFRTLVQLNHQFCVEKAAIGFGTTPAEIIPFLSEVNEVEKHSFKALPKNGTEKKRTAVLIGSLASALGAVGAVSAVTFFNVASRNLAAAVVPLAMTSCGLAYLYKNVLKNAPEQDKEDIFKKNSFMLLFQEYGVDALIDAGFTVERLKEKLNQDLLESRITPWDLICFNRHKLLRDKGIITQEHFDYLNTLKQGAEPHLDRTIYVRRYSVFWDVYAAAPEAIAAAVSIDAQYKKHLGE